MKTLTRILILALALVMLSSVAIAENTFPLTTEPVTLKILSRTNAFFPNQNIGNVYNMKYYEELTGVHIEWENIDPSVFTQTLAGIIAGGEEMPDVIYKANITNAQSYEWGEEGLLVDITPYIESCMPNFKALLEKYPDIRLAITAPNGAIYGLPQVIPDAPMRVPNKLYVNKLMLEKAGKEMPTTTEDLKEILIALRDLDFDGDGAADGIVPLSSSTDGIYSYFAGAFGLRTRGAHHDTVDVDPETGAIRIYAQSDNYRKMLEYLHDLYTEKLIYQELYTEGNKTLGVLSADHKLGMQVYTTLANVPGQLVDEWVGLKGMITGPDGYDKVAMVRSTLHTEGNYVVTKDCKNIEIALKWVDYFYSWDGGMMYHAGVEGVNWEKKDDGSYGYTDETLATWAENMSQDAFISQFALWPGGRNPALMPAELWAGEFEAEPANTAYAMMEHINDVVWPIFSWSEDELEVITNDMTDIKATIKNRTAQFITGEVEINDANWNDFVKSIDNAGGQRVIDAYTSAVQRIYGDNPY
jgi:putative aldouronate transport system substrate-binding protein